MRKIIATIQLSDGNESVGTMWSETAVFEADTPVKDIMHWGATASRYNSAQNWELTKSLNVTLSLAQEPDND